MKQVKVGLIGLGFMGSTHFRIYEAMPNAKIVALADVDAKKRAGDVSSVIGNIGNSDNSVPLCMDGIHTYENAFDLINDPEVELVDICCPTPDHAKYIIAALAAGKHVFAEKPLCRNREQEKEISDAVANAKSFINFGMCVRAWPEYRYAWELFQSGKCGKMLTATFRRLSPSIDGNHWENWFMDKECSGGALLDMHLHDTDAICYFFGKSGQLIRQFNDLTAKRVFALSNICACRISIGKRVRSFQYSHVKILLISREAHAPRRIFR